MSDETVTLKTRWVGGHGAPDRARTLVSAFEGSAHTLNYATAHGAGGAESPSQIYSLLAGLYTGTGHLPQGLRQLAARLAEMNEAGSLDMRQGDPDDVTEAVIRANRDLHTAAQAAEQMTAALRRAQNAISAVGMTEQAGAAVDRAYGDPNDDDNDDENED